MNIESVTASKLYGTTKSLQQMPSEQDSASFADALRNALTELRDTVERGEQATSEAMSGRSDVQSLVEALTATEMALETAVAVRDKVVEAYQEVLRMPV
jgi:flagellar hook-basal body complex protein FliE